MKIIFIDLTSINVTKYETIWHKEECVTLPSNHHSSYRQLSYSSASPALSDKSMYKKFYRVFPPESSFNPAKISLLRAFDWNKVGTLTESQVELFALVSEVRLTTVCSVSEQHKQPAKYDFPCVRQIRCPLCPPDRISILSARYDIPCVRQIRYPLCPPDTISLVSAR